MNKKTFLDKLRAAPWLVSTLALALTVGWLYPHQIGVLLWSLTKLTLGAYLGYWIDRSIFCYARPGDLFQAAAYRTEQVKVPLLYAALGAMLRRAAIMAAAILALGLGV